MKPNSKIKILILMALIGSAGLTIQPASALTHPFEKKFTNCSALNKVYPGGVAKSAKTVNRGGVTTRVPVVSARVYAENIGKDRDKDGIACEK